jgi:hypothetical protein
MDSPEAGKLPAQISYIKYLKDHYNNLSKIFGYAMKPPEGLINDYGYRSLNDWNDLNKALEFFKKNVENYPQSGKCVR